MKITIESTSQIILVRLEDCKEGIACRVWEGHTDSGIALQCLIPRIAVLDSENLTQFAAELLEQKAPSAAVEDFPLRMIL
jgi:hypothetical protein